MKFFTLLFLAIFIINNIQAQDWANLNRYKIDNEKIKIQKSNDDTIIFFGDSITEGWYKSDSSFFDGRNYINRGISGQTTPQMLIRFQQDVVKLNPKIVVILAGTNDIAGNTGPTSLEMIMDNLISMSQLAQSNNIIPILCSVLPVIDYPWKQGLNPAAKIDSLNMMIKYFAQENEIIYLDYYSSMVNENSGLKSEYTFDGVHPNKKGYNIMKPLAEKSINNALNENSKKEKILGLRTTVYKVPNLNEAKKWYSQAFGINPYFDEPFYVGFNIGGYELGLLPDDSPTSEKTEGVIAYWGVNEIEKTYRHFLNSGATKHENPNNVGGPIMVASVKDPWGNIIGLIYNPEFKLK